MLGCCSPDLFSASFQSLLDLSVISSIFSFGISAFLLFSLIGALLLAVLLIRHRRTARNAFFQFGVWPIHRLVSSLAIQPWFRSFSQERGKFLYVDLKKQKGLFADEKMLPKPRNSVRFVCISDSHLSHWELLDRIPAGDVFLHAGDIFVKGQAYGADSRLQQLVDFNSFLGQLPHRLKLFIGGNHDFVLEDLGREKVQEVVYNARYLENSSFSVNVSSLLEGNTTINDTAAIKIFGSPLSWGVSENTAFQVAKESVALIDALRQFPDQIDILMTHGNPANHQSLKSGSKCLKERVMEIGPAIHIFGHQ